MFARDLFPSLYQAPTPARPPLHSPPQARPRKRSSSEARAKLGRSYPSPKKAVPSPSHSQKANPSKTKNEKLPTNAPILHTPTLSLQNQKRLNILNL